MNIFDQQTNLMKAWGQSTTGFNFTQAALYVGLVEEESTETKDAWEEFRANPVTAKLAEVVDGAIDTIVVSIGLLRSIGVDPQAAWNEVLRSNQSKIDPATGTVLRNEAGKVMKPATFSPPNLVRVMLTGA